jgi:hypothetical protein
MTDESSLIKDIMESMNLSKPDSPLTPKIELLIESALQPYFDAKEVPSEELLNKLTKLKNLTKG